MVKCTLSKITIYFTLILYSKQQANLQTQQLSQSGQNSLLTPEIKTEPDFKPTNPTEFLENPLSESQNNMKETRSKIGVPSMQNNNYNVADYRSLVKTLVCGVKTITWGCAACKVFSICNN